MRRDLETLSMKAVLVTEFGVSGKTNIVVLILIKMQRELRFLSREGRV